MAQIVLNPMTGTLVLVPTTSIRAWPLTDWNNDVEDSGGALMTTEHNQKIFKFSQGAAQSVRAQFKVPYDYSYGQLKAKVVFYAPDVIGKFLMQARATLRRQGVDGAGFNTNYHDSINTILTVATNSEQLTEIYFDLSGTDGKINSILPQKEDIIDIKITRITGGGDDVVGDIRMIPFTEILKA